MTTVGRWRPMTGPAAARSPLLLTGRLVAARRRRPRRRRGGRGHPIRFAGPARELPAAWRSACPSPRAGRPGPRCCPGAVDVHCHGGAGGEFGAGPPTRPRPPRATTTATARRRCSAAWSRAAATALVAGVPPAPRWWPAATWPASTSRARSSPHARRGAQDPAALTDVDPSLSRRWAWPPSPPAAPRRAGPDDLRPGTPRR